jgi:putative PIN family toxin of toxin-antitoxin system
MILRVVVDTNIIISATFWGNQPRELLKKAILGELQLLTSPDILAELFRVLNYSKFVAQLQKVSKTPQEIVSNYQQLCEFVEPSNRSVPAIIRDTKDQIILDCAIFGKADYIVTGDSDLLVLDPYQTIRIINLSDFLQFL